VIPHQASITLLRDISADIGIGFDRFWINMSRYANTAGATVPIALHEASTSGALKSDDWVMFFAAGAGMTAGAALYRWH
jgi:3-oxoacyl-[acyl-carrier-protein] synthase-3